VPGGRRAASGEDGVRLRIGTGVTTGAIPRRRALAVPVCIAMLACLAVLGFASGQAAAGDPTLTTSTTSPLPDPPPTAAPKPDSPPTNRRRARPTRATAPTPPPPPPPSQEVPPPKKEAPTQTAQQPPAAPPAVEAPRPRTRPSVSRTAPKPRIVRKPVAQPRARLKLPGRVESKAAPVAGVALSLPAAEPSSSSELVLLFLVISGGLSLVLLGLAATPPWALPRQVSLALYDHRQTLALTGIVIVASVGLAVVVAGLAS
jgi:hypothetical protein